MNYRVVVIAMMGIASVLACHPSSADPRSPPRVDEVAVPTAEPDVWLRRMVGRFSFEGNLEVQALRGCQPQEEQEGQIAGAGNYCTSVKGIADCIAIGTGPGVQCVLNVTWQDLYREEFSGDRPGSYELPGGVSYLDPAMLLFGLDPGKGAINELLVDSKGLPEGGLGTTKGNRATFKTPCVNSASLFNAMYPGTIYRTCERIIRIDAKPDSRTLFLMIDIHINEGEAPYTSFILTLRRLEQGEAGEVSTAPRAKR